MCGCQSSDSLRSGSCWAPRKARSSSHLSPTLLRPAFGVLLLYLGFSFVMNPGGDRTTGVALPAGLAALASATLARVLGRRVARQPPEKHSRCRRRAASTTIISDALDRGGQKHEGPCNAARGPAFLFRVLH